MASKSVTVNFDDNAQSVLKEVDPIHRDSIINVGLALVSKTEYYKTLTGVSSDTLGNVASLSSLDDLEAELEAETPSGTATKAQSKPKATTSGSDWDNF